MSDAKKSLGARLSGVTRQQQAIRIERQEAKRENPVVALFLGAGRKLLGVVVVFVAHDRLLGATAMTGVPQYVFGAIALLIGAFGFFLLMPDVTMTFLRFFGLGGLVDKLLKRKAES